MKSQRINFDLIREALNEASGYIYEIDKNNDILNIIDQAFNETFKY